MHVLTIKLLNESTYEYHMLNPGDHFPLFGGSRQGIVVGEGLPAKDRTASLIVRRTGPMGTEDTEYDINDMRPWSFIIRCLNNPVNMTAIAPDWMRTKLNQVLDKEV